MGYEIKNTDKGVIVDGRSVYLVDDHSFSRSHIEIVRASTPGWLIVWSWVHNRDDDATDKFKLDSVWARVDDLQHFIDEAQRLIVEARDAAIDADNERVRRYRTSDS